MNKFDYRSIKTFEDACKHLNLDPNAFYYKFENMPDHITALISLEVITRALNDGWRHPLDGTTTVYFPWFWIASQREEKESWFKDIPESRKVSYMRPDGSAGLGSAHSDIAWSSSTSPFGSRLACKSDEIARYCAETFKSYWESYLFPQPWQIEEKHGLLW